MGIRVIPVIPKIKAHWCHRASEIPDWLEVPLSNNTTVKYYPKVEQPSFVKSLEIIQNMKEQIVGYERKTGGAANTNRP